jgi:hypothetical protein
MVLAWTKILDVLEANLKSQSCLLSVMEHSCIWPATASTQKLFFKCPLCQLASVFTVILVCFYLFPCLCGGGRVKSMKLCDDLDGVGVCTTNSFKPIPAVESQLLWASSLLNHRVKTKSLALPVRGTPSRTFVWCLFGQSPHNCAAHWEDC